MNLARSIMQSETQQVFFEKTSLTSLMEQGIYSLQQGQYRESHSLFMQARAHPQAAHTVLLDLLDALIVSQEHCLQAQQALHKASKCFVEAERMQEQQLHELQQAMETLQGEAQCTEQRSQCSTQTETTEEKEGGAHTLVITMLPPGVTSTQVNVQEDEQKLALTITCFGHFEVKRGKRIVHLGSNRSGQAILRYLMTKLDYSASKDELMGLFWSELSGESARRKLQVAISAIRCALNDGCLQNTGGGYILYRDPRYLINPAIQIHTDAGEFLELWKAGQQAQEQDSVDYFERACALYTAPFMADDLFVDWSYLQREELKRYYLVMCHTLTAYYLRAGCYEQAEKWGKAILRDNHCDELAHRQLMSIYILQGMRNEAIRQYQQCTSLLHKELGVNPLQETQQLFQSIISGVNPPIEGA